MWIRSLPGAGPFDSSAKRDCVSIEQAKLVLGQFGDVIGLADLALDERGYACLTFDDLAVNMEYEPSRDALALFSWLGEADRGRGALFAELLEANLMAHATGEPVFGYEATGQGVVLLDRLILAGLDIVQLQERLDGFLKVASTWRARLAQGRTDGEAEVRRAPGPTPFMLRA
jgi:Tir chaperone protein (CesT) family